MGLETRMKDAFDCIAAGEALRASTKEFLRGARGRADSRRQYLWVRHARLAMGTACALVAVFLCIGGYAMLWMPISYVSIDVNPSLELALNRLDRVIYAKAYNEDGERIAEKVQMKGMRYGEAIDLLVGSDAMRPYLTEGADLTFTVASASGQREERLLSDIANSAGCQEHGGISVRGDMGAVEEAHGNGLSLGKYTAYQILLQYDDSVTVQDCHGMSMSQIMGLIEEHEHGIANGYGNGNGAGSGNGAGNGYSNGNGAGNGYSNGNGGCGHGFGHGH